MGILITEKIDPVKEVTALLASLLIIVATMKEVAIIANLAIGIIIQKLHKIGTATPEEITKMDKDIKYLYFELI